MKGSADGKGDVVGERKEESERERERKRDSHSFACRAFKLSDAIKSTYLVPLPPSLRPNTYMYYTDTSSLGATCTTPGQRPPLPTTGAIRYRYC